MVVMVCLDDHNGMLFNQRRQSKDQLVIKDMMKECLGKRLYMNAYSEALFHEQKEEIVVQENFLTQIEREAYCFVENQRLVPYEKEIEKLIVYRWNRHYPADFYLDLNLEKGWKKISTKDFKGFSHEKITKEIYIHE